MESTPLANLFVSAKNFFEAVCPEFHACLVSSEIHGKKIRAQVITLCNVTQFKIFLFESHDGRTGEDNLQARKTVVTHTQLSAPFGMFEHLVDQQYFSTTFLKFVGKVNNAVTREVKLFILMNRQERSFPNFLWRIGEGKWFSLRHVSL